MMWGILVIGVFKHNSKIQRSGRVESCLNIKLIMGLFKRLNGPCTIVHGGGGRRL